LFSGGSSSANKLGENFSFDNPAKCSVHFYDLFFQDLSKRISLLLDVDRTDGETSMNSPLAAYRAQPEDTQVSLVSSHRSSEEAVLPHVPEATVTERSGSCFGA
jgi:hypothetical protein